MEKDVRKTIDVNGSFHAIVKELFQNNQKAALLYEDSGVTRANGFIISIFDRDDEAWLKLDSGTEIAISKIYAVNGTFASDYSEC